MTLGAVCGVGAVSALGGADALVRGACTGRGRQLELPSPTSRNEARGRQQMSRGAQLAAVALKETLDDCGWISNEDVAYYLGVGASGGSTAQLESMLLERLSDLAARAEASLTRESRSFERLCAAARHHLIVCDDALFGDTQTLTLPLPPTDPRTATIYGARYILYVETSLRLFYVRDRTGLKDRVAALFQRHSAAF